MQEQWGTPVIRQSHLGCGGGLADRCCNGWLQHPGGYVEAHRAGNAPNYQEGASTVAQSNGVRRSPVQKGPGLQ